MKIWIFEDSTNPKWNLDNSYLTFRVALHFLFLQCLLNHLKERAAEIWSNSTYNEPEYCHRKLSVSLLLYIFFITIVNMKPDQSDYWVCISNFPISTDFLAQRTVYYGLSFSNKPSISVVERKSVRKIFQIPLFLPSNTLDYFLVSFTVACRNRMGPRHLYGNISQRYALEWHGRAKIILIHLRRKKQNRKLHQKGEGNSLCSHKPQIVACGMDEKCLFEKCGKFIETDSKEVMNQINYPKTQ